jgi:CBS domain-containing protein
MKVRDVMTPRPCCCRRETTVQEAAREMLTHDCGSLPVLEGDPPERIVGVVTDRDIALRVVAAGRDPARTRVEDIMSHPVAVVVDGSSIEECIRSLEQNQIRRAPVVNDSGHLVGMVSQADIARTCDVKHVAELVREVSQGIDIGHR